MTVAAPEPEGASAPETGEIVLSVQGVSKRFGGTQALDDVSLDLERGKVLALLGENGAGKSTLIKILAGVHAPDEGTILFRGVKTSPADLPITFIHQDLGLIDWMTVAENVCLSLGYPCRAGLIRMRAMRRRARGGPGQARRGHRSGRAGRAIDADREGAGRGQPRAGIERRHHRDGRADGEPARERGRAVVRCDRRGFAARAWP